MASMPNPRDEHRTKISTPVEILQLNGQTSGAASGYGPDARTDGEIIVPPGAQSDFMRTLGDFCAQLSRLRKEAGISVEVLAKDSRVPLGRSQIYDTLRGQVSSPPSWEFVQAFVSKCATHADRASISLPTDLEYWRREHGLLAHLHEKSRGRSAVVSPTEPVRLGRDGGGRVLTVQETSTYRLPPGPDGRQSRIGVITSDIRQVRCADIWVNSENTDMVMARVQECSVSAIIRYEGAERDAGGRVVVDHVADELEAKVAALRPLGPCGVVVTGAGELARRNGVRFVIHVAAVHGAPGAGFQPVKEIGRCVANALTAAEDLVDPRTPATVLFPLLSCGEAGGEILPTAQALIHTAVNHLRAVPGSRIGTVLFLAYTDVELWACLQALGQVSALSREVPASRAGQVRRGPVPPGPGGARRPSGDRGSGQIRWQLRRS
ncbi:macro domain-containing protein [Plantactinospora siamensis]|uniref:Macro domain-containing protein n=1 Tax=Plantactinospora siamensis TaxID=555372 RepID=A0ABV6P6D4_9ACTN